MWHQFVGQSTMMFGDRKVFFYGVDKEKELFLMNLEGLDKFFTMLDSVGKKAIGNAIILFDGYNDVTTELFEVPQVRKYVKEMFNRYPHLLNYINFDLEGHHWLLSCLLDLETMYTGKKLTFDEHIKKYGIDTPMPRFNVHLNMPTPLLNHLTSSMRQHGAKINALNKVQIQVSRLNKIFNRAI